MKKDVLNKSMLAAVGILIAASMAFAKSPSLDLGRSSKNSAAAETNAMNKKHKSSPSQPMDAIKVVGHIPLAGGPITRFVCTQHYSSDYLYAEHGAGKDITLIDVTKTEQPSVLANVPDAPDGELGRSRCRCRDRCPCQHGTRYSCRSDNASNSQDHGFFRPPTPEDRSRVHWGYGNR